MIFVIAKLSRRKRGPKFMQRGKIERRKILDEEFATGWGMAPGIGIVVLPIIAFFTILRGGTAGNPDGFPWIGLLICAAVGVAIGMLTTLFSTGIGSGGGSGSSGSGSSGSNSSDSWSSSSSGGSSSSSDSGGGGSSGGGGASGDY